MSAMAAVRTFVTLDCVALAAILAWALLRGDLAVPDRWLPWKALHIADEPNILTRFKLASLDDPATCRAVLAEARMRLTPIVDREIGRGCGFRNAVRIEATTAQLGTPITLSCRAAVSLALWERHSLQPEAVKRFGQRVAWIEHFGSYACRNVNSRVDGRRSQHATADAFDVAGFILADGRRIHVLGDWEDGDENARFLHAVRDGACRYFDAVLGPDYNRAHRDHLHLDRGAFRSCR